MTSETLAYAREMRALYRSAEQRAVRFRLLVEMGRDLAAARDVDTLLRLAVVRATTFSGYDSGYVLLLDPADTLALRAVARLDGQAEQMEIPAFLLALAEQLLDERQPLLCSSPGGSTPLATICLPLASREGYTQGVLLLAGTVGTGEPDSDDLDALQLLASQLATAIERTRLYEEQERLLHALTEREHRLEELVEQLLRAQDEERRRIAYELHDGLAQMTLGVLQQLHTLADRYRPRAPHSRRALDQALMMSRAAVTEARQVIAGLRPTVLDDFGLAKALQVQSSLLQEEGWELSYSETLGNRRLPPSVETALYRVAQEALSNVRKHAGTTRVELALWLEGDRVCLTIRDEGRGFDTGRLGATAEPGSRIGLLGMQERVHLLRGRWEISSQPGAGALISVSIPLGAGGQASCPREANR